jgi:serine/threonine protein kinase
MADVYLARQSGLRGFQKTVVVKVIHEQLAESSEFVDMLFDEAQIAAMIKHPNVVDIYDLGQAGGTYFIAMEYIAGKSLFSVLSASKKAHHAPLDIYSATHIVAEAADALTAAHKLKSATGEPLNLVHRDVTPGNIMIAFQGNVKLVDFGVAKSLGRVTTTAAGNIKGKMGYHSPEQIKDRPIDSRSDIFSLGIVLWEALTLGRLFKADSPAGIMDMTLDSERRPPSDFRTEIPAELDQICLRALAVEPADRYQSSAEMANDLREVLGAANYYKGKTVIANYMNANFGESIERVRELLELVATSDTSVAVGADEDQDLSEPMSVLSRRAAGLATIPSQPADFEAQYSQISIVQENPIKRKALAGAAVVALLIIGIAVGVLLMGGDDDSGKAVAVVPPPEHFDAAAIEQAADATAIVDLQVPVDAAPAVSPPDPDNTAAQQKAERAQRRKQAKARYQAGMAKYRSGKLKPAKADLQAALKLNPGYAPAYKGLGHVYEGLGVKSKAVMYFRKYLRAAPRAKDKGKIAARILRLGG